MIKCYCHCDNWSNIHYLVWGNGHITCTCLVVRTPTISDACVNFIGIFCESTHILVVRMSLFPHFITAGVSGNMTLHGKYWQECSKVFYMYMTYTNTKLLLVHFIILVNLSCIILFPYCTHGSALASIYRDHRGYQSHDYGIVGIEPAQGCYFLSNIFDPACKWVNAFVWD